MPIQIEIIKFTLKLGRDGSLVCDKYQYRPWKINYYWLTTRMFKQRDCVQNIKLTLEINAIK